MSGQPVAARDSGCRPSLLLALLLEAIALQQMRRPPQQQRAGCWRLLWGSRHASQSAAQRHPPQHHHHLCQQDSRPWRRAAAAARCAAVLLSPGPGRALGVQGGMHAQLKLHAPGCQRSHAVACGQRLVVHYAAPLGCTSKERCVCCATLHGSWQQPTTAAAVRGTAHSDQGSSPVCVGGSWLRWSCACFFGSKQ